MRKLLVAFTAALLATAPAAAAEWYGAVHTTPPRLPHVMPQGAPLFVVGATSHAPVQLRFALVNGKRVLFEPASGQVVYVLKP